MKTTIIPQTVKKGILIEGKGRKIELILRGVSKNGKESKLEFEVRGVEDLPSLVLNSGRKVVGLGDGITINVFDIFPKNGGKYARLFCRHDEKKYSARVTNYSK